MNKLENRYRAYYIGHGKILTCMSDKSGVKSANYSICNIEHSVDLDEHRTRNDIGRKQSSKFCITYI